MPRTATKITPVSFRLTPEAMRILRQAEEWYGHSRSAVVETALRQLAVVIGREMRAQKKSESSP